jgi:predicted DCC family thiol-disulfide oxidoreductase YuxK
MDEHLIFYDHDCPFCNKSVKHVLDIDKNRRFIFAPLGGETAANILCGPLKEFSEMNSIVLIENYQSTGRKFWVRSKAVWRIYWLAGNGWGIIGWISFLPCWIGDLLYRWIAEHRHQFKLKPMKELGPSDRFLP